MNLNPGGVCMKCPYCGDVMESGYVQCRNGVYWTPKKLWNPVFASITDGAIPIGRDDKLMPNSKALAYHCPACKTIVIPYGEELC